MNWHEDRGWEDDHWAQRDRETAWDRAEDMERAADRLNERLNRDKGEATDLASAIYASRKRRLQGMEDAA